MHQLGVNCIFFIGKGLAYPEWVIASPLLSFIVIRRNVLKDNLK